MNRVDRDVEMVVGPPLDIPILAVRVKEPVHHAQVSGLVHLVVKPCKGLKTESEIRTHTVRAPIIVFTKCKDAGDAANPGAYIGRKRLWLGYSRVRLAMIGI